MRLIISYSFLLKETVDVVLNIGVPIAIAIQCDPLDNTLKYLVFDSKFTRYENLSRHDDRGVKFLTIRRRGSSIVKGVEAIPSNEWKILEYQEFRSYFWVSPKFPEYNLSFVVFVISDLHTN